MRSDMAKVICERPRRKNKGKLALRLNRHEARIDPEGAPVITSMKRLHAVYLGPGGLKEHGEHLKPLIRWLRKNVGRCWNDVFSELCDQLDRRSTVQRHVLFHVDGYVIRHVLIINGVPHLRMGLSQPLELWDSQLYVDPDGMLCQHKQMN
jgi:hypothetical protein